MVKDGDTEDAKYKAINYDKDGNLYNEKGEKTGETIVLESIGKPVVKNGKLVVKDKDGKEISDHKYEPSGQNTLIHAEEATKFPFSSIIKVS